MQDFSSLIAHNINLQKSQVSNTIQLLVEGNTVPFITRYRKEVTGGLDENQIREVQEKFEYHTALEDRKNAVIESIQSQDKLTSELEEKIRNADKLKTVEDLYLPYKQKKRTLATIAKEKGLEPLSDEIWEQKIQDGTFLKGLEEAVNPENELETVEDVLKGIQHILAEKISEDVDIREELRSTFKIQGIIETKATKDEESKKEQSDFQDYFEFSQSVSTIPPHRILAINRGEKMGAIRVYLRVPEEEICANIAQRVLLTQESKIGELIHSSIHDSFHRLLNPSLCRELRSDLTLVAEEHAIGVFAQNLRKVLLCAPVRGKRILGIDPSFRTGCKLASLDDLGKLLEVGVMFPHAPQKRVAEAKKIMIQQIQRHQLELVVIGNGTAHRETEEFVSTIIQEENLDIEYIIVNEAGASVYSTSKEAQEEFPDLDASYRGTVSIARRLQDPLAEIVKIDPKAMGVGLYQHDVNPKNLSKAVDSVVESCVNYVGVNLNTASISLLKQVSGLNRLQARRIYEWRQKKGAFVTRDSLLKVRGVGEDTFIQSAGFLRIPDGENPLDNTQIHPESYDKTCALLEKIQISPKKLQDSAIRKNLHQALDALTLSKVAKELEIGLPTLKDIVENLKKPGLDPRDSLPKPFFRKGLLKLEDLKPDMEVQGTVRNVVDFGAFVDIGVKEDGLIHISQMADKFVDDPLKVLSVGDIVKVRILEVDVQRRRISLSRKRKTKETGRRAQKSDSPSKKKNSPSFSGKIFSSGKKKSSGLGALGALLQKKGNYTTKKNKK